MSEQEQQIAIAKATGVPFDICMCGDSEKSHRIGGNEHSFSPMAELPDYLHDLNAMDEATKTLDRRQRIIFCNNLTNICGGTEEAIDASAAKRAKAFLLTVNKWKE